MISIDYKDRRPLYQQIMEKIESLAAQGLIVADEQLPSVRTLAMELSINPNTIQRAYSELEKKGIIYSLSGKGSFLAKDTATLVAEQQNQVWHRLQELIATAGQLHIDCGTFNAKVNEFYQHIGGGTK